MSLQKKIKCKQRRSIEVIVLSHENYAQPNRMAVILEIPLLKKLIYLLKKLFNVRTLDGYEYFNTLNYDGCAIKIENHYLKWKKEQEWDIDLRVKNKPYYIFT